jgi:predicted O-methyltransferase YrrM
MTVTERVMLFIARALRFMSEEIVVFPAARIIGRERARRPNPIQAAAFAHGFGLRGFDVAIAPAQIRSELQMLAQLLREESPSVVVEIGTAQGGSFFVFSTVAADDAVLISIDLPHGPFRIVENDKSRRERLYRSFALPTQTIHRLRADSHDPHTVRKVARILGTHKIDFLFIDGDHTYEGVRADYENYAQLVRPDGLVGFHDIVPGRPELVGAVPEFWQELKRSGETQEIVEDWGQGGYGIGLIRCNEQSRRATERLAAAELILPTNSSPESHGRWRLPLRRPRRC